MKPIVTKRPAGLRKAMKLCSAVDIDRLFAGRDGCSQSIAYPLRAVWRSTDTHDGVRFLVSIPKKRLRHAVDRVRMRRLVREAYRLQRAEAEAASAVEARGLDLAFVYIADSLKPQSAINASMHKLLISIHKIKNPETNS